MLCYCMCMPRVAAPVTLADDEKLALRKLSRSKESDGRVAFRAHLILLSAQGLQNKEIAERLGCTPQVVKQWKDRWSAEKLQGLEDRPRPGRTPKLTAKKKQQVVTRACQKPPRSLGRWTVRTLAGKVGLNRMQVQRILQEHDLKLHQLRSFTFSPDPDFEDKLLEVVGLYMNPPENAVILCVDEKTGIQALDRTQPMLPLKAKKPRAWTNEYVRHGTRSLLACLDIKTGEVHAHVRKRRTSKDFLSFMDSVVDEFPKQRLHVVLDNLNIHKNDAAEAWLADHPQVSFHFTPTHASWVNLIECFFSILTKQGLQQKAFRSVRDLERFLKQFILDYNVRCGPFEWTAGPEKLQRIIELTKKFQLENND